MKTKAIDEIVDYAVAKYGENAPKKLSDLTGLFIEYTNHLAELADKIQQKGLGNTHESMYNKLNVN